MLQTHKLGATAYPTQSVLEAVTPLARAEDNLSAQTVVFRLVQAVVFRLARAEDNLSGRAVVNLLVQAVAKR